MMFFSMYAGRDCDSFCNWCWVEWLVHQQIFSLGGLGRGQ